MKKVNILMIFILLYVDTSFAQDCPFQISKYKSGKQCAVTFTFDDGLTEHLTIVAPELEKRGWRGSFGICGAKVSGEIKVDDRYLSWEHVSELSRRGHEISNHGWNHKKLTKLERNRVIEELHMNDSAIFAHIGKRPTTVFYPYNSKNPLVIEMAQSGRVGTRLKQYALGQAVDEEKTKRRMDDALSRGEWVVWMTHGITKGYDAFKEPERFSRFLDYVFELASKVWVATFHEVSSYMIQRDAVKISTERQGKKWIVTPALELDSALYDQELTLVLGQYADRIRVKQNGRRLQVYILDNIAYVDFNPYQGPISIKW